MRPRLIRQVNTGSTLGQIMYRELKASHGALPLINPPLGSAPKGISPSYRPGLGSGRVMEPVLTLFATLPCCCSQTD